MKKTITCVCLAMICMIFGACGGRAPAYFAYRERDFFAEVRGQMNGVDFVATVRMQRLAEGGEALEVRYTAPEAMEGVTVSALRDGDGVLRSASATMGEITVPMEGASVRGWLRPLLCLLELTEFSTVQKREGAYLLTFADGEELTLAPVADGLFPRSFSSREISFSVIWAEKQAVSIVEVHKNGEFID
ncbi:MAG: hypothetical protein IJX62_01655 [Clostridia bacterium]|nr:hypothetical protein [Clostridia bacterium]